ncbi:MAG: hypothetical protein EA409_06915 [Saprospirales bacterium]|nr:MAG: hypothetical protein EA409_06915 [Saprospirales bacterium]
MTTLILLASIFFNTIVLVVFKYFALREIDVYKAIIYNYLVCIALGMISTGSIPIASAIGQPYLYFSLVLGIIFVFGFNVAALTVKYFGLTITSILQRTALVITVVYAILVFDEALGWTKVMAITMALGAIILVNLPLKKPTKRASDAPAWVLLLPVGMFLVNGVIDTILFHIEASQITSTGDITMIINIFSFALISGIIYGFLKQGRNFFRLKKQTIQAAFILGIPNFFSIYFVLRLFGGEWDGSVAVPLNNIGILCAATLTGLLVFRERLTPFKAGGLILAIFSVILFSRVI